MGAVAGYALSLDNERRSAALARFQPKIADNVKTRNVTLDWIMKKQKKYSGGLEIGVRFRHKKKAKIGEAGNHVGAWQYYDKLNTGSSDTVKTGRELWKNLNVPVTLSHEESIENASPNNFDRIKEGTEESMDILAEQVNDILWGVSAGGDLVGTPITDIVSGSDTVTVHGFSKSTTSNTFLQSQNQANIGDVTDNLLDAMTDGFNDAVDNSPAKNDSLDLWLSSKGAYGAIQKVLPAYVQYESNKKVDIGFPTLVYMGMPYRFDSTIPDQADGKAQAFGLNSKYWEFAVEKTMNFATTKFYDMLPEQAADVAQIFLRYAVVCNNPRTNVRLADIEL